MTEKELIALIGSYESKPHLSHDERQKLQKAVGTYINTKPGDPEIEKKRRQYYGLDK